VVSPWSLGGRSVVSRWSVGGHSVVSRWSVGCQSVISRWSLGGQSVVSRWSLGGQRVASDGDAVAGRTAGLGGHRARPVKRRLPAWRPPHRHSRHRRQTRHPALRYGTHTVAFDRPMQ